MLENIFSIHISDGHTQNIIRNLNLPRKQSISSTRHVAYFKDSAKTTCWNKYMKANNKTVVNLVSRLKVSILILFYDRLRGSTWDVSFYVTHFHFPEVGNSEEVSEHLGEEVLFLAFALRFLDPSFVVPHISVKLLTLPHSQRQHGTRIGWNAGKDGKARLWQSQREKLYYSFFGKVNDEYYLPNHRRGIIA